MVKIRLTQQAYLTSGEYRLHTDTGKPATGILSGEYYTASATDNAGNEYSVFWEITGTDGNGNHIVSWDDPIEVYSWTDNKPIEAVIKL